MHLPETEPITSMTEEESWAQLSSATLGRLVVSVDGQPDIFPVNFVVQNRTVLFRTAEGAKLAGAVINPRVAFEADDHDVMRGWSVIVHGHAQVVETAEEIARAERAQVLPWIATPKNRFVRITPDRITGRRFSFGGEPEEFYDLG